MCSATPGISGQSCKSFLQEALARRYLVGIAAQWFCPRRGFLSGYGYGIVNLFPLQDRLRLDAPVGKRGQPAKDDPGLNLPISFGAPFCFPRLPRPWRA